MVNVLVIGAGGYIGNAVAISLRRAGHKVWGLVRKTDQAEQLKLNEIIPIIGDISDTKVYEPIYDSVSHIIEATGFASGPTSKILYDSVFAYAEKRPIDQKLTFISNSGILVYGKQADGVVLDEAIHRPNNSPIFTGLIETEERMIKSNHLNGVVIRSGWVFGGTGGHLLDDYWSYDSKTGDFDFKGTPNKIWSFIHIVDLANLYVKIVEAPASIIAHQIFNAANDSQTKVMDYRIAMARAAGAIGKLISVPALPDPFSQERELTIIVSNKKAKQLLGWAPKFDFLDDITIYYQSWKAANTTINTKK